MKFSVNFHSVTMNRWTYFYSGHDHRLDPGAGFTKGLRLRLKSEFFVFAKNWT